MDTSNIPTPENEKVEHLGFQTICKNLLPELDELSDTSTTKEEKIKVFIRIRPFIRDELSKADIDDCYFKTFGENSLLISQDGVNMSKSSIVGKLPPSLPPLKYTFSRVFNESVNQKEFFDHTTFGMIRDFINGQNCLIFTYGVTNSGKTYTMMGEPSDPGVMPRAMDVIFNSINGRLYDKANIRPDMHSDVVRVDEKHVLDDVKFKETLLSSISSHDKFVTTIANVRPSQSTSSLHSEDDRRIEGETFEQEIATAMATRKREDARLHLNSSSQIRYSVWVSMVEIYNDIPFDLLVPLPKKKTFVKRVPLKLKEDGHGYPYVKDLKEIHVTNADEAFKLLAIGKRNLQIATTSLNHVSSRSHCIFNVKLIKIEAKDDQIVAKISTLSLCDLAGSEPNSKSGNIGERFKEANNINNSLMVLGRCIKSLRQNQMNPDSRKHVMIPFRESKLTKLFQNFLVGKGQACMIVQINKLRSMIAENINTIKFSAITNQVVMMPVQAAAISMKGFNKQPENVEGKNKRKTIEWADENEISECKKASLMCDNGNDTEDIEEEDENDSTIEDDEEDHLPCRRRELRLNQQLKDEKAKYVEMETDYETRMHKLVEIHLKNVDRIEDTYKNRLDSQAEYYEAMMERRVNYCLDDMKSKKKDYEQTIALLQEDLKAAKKKKVPTATLR